LLKGHPLPIRTSAAAAFAAASPTVAVSTIFPLLAARDAALRSAAMAALKDLFVSGDAIAVLGAVLATARKLAGENNKIKKDGETAFDRAMRGLCDAVAELSTSCQICLVNGIVEEVALFFSF
jgi:hypothetical protein